jgi:hypothetical protein
VFKRKKRSDRSVTFRFQGENYTLKRGYTFLPLVTVNLDGELTGTLTVNKQLEIEVVSID